MWWRCHCDGDEKLLSKSRRRVQNEFGILDSAATVLKQFKKDMLSRNISIKCMCFGILASAASMLLKHLKLHMQN